MTEIFSMPVPEDVVRQQWCVYHDTVRWLATARGGYTLAQLDLIRRDLHKGGRWASANVPAGVYKHQAQLLLHDVATALTEKRGEGFEGYYRLAGDILEAAPDDLSSLEP